MPVDRRVDGALGAARRAPGEGEIFAHERAFAAVIGELRAQPLMRAVVLGDDQKAGGVLVEPVHDARPLHAADAGERVAAMRDQRVDQCAGRMPGRRMHHEAARLVDDDEIVVLVDDIERDIFALRLRIVRRRHVDHDRVGGVDAVFGIADGPPADRDRAVENERFQPRARQALDPRRQHAIEARAGILGRRDDGLCALVSF